MYSFNMAYRDEDNILYQIYLKQICLDFYYHDYEFFEHYTEINNNTGEALKPILLSSFEDRDDISMQFASLDFRPC